MSTASLREIQAALTQLWSSPDALETFKTGRKIEGFPEELQEGLESSLVEFYYNSVWGHRFQHTRGLYRVTRRALAAKWVQTVERFWTMNQASSSDFFTTLASFPNFLRAENADTLEKLPFVADLAEFELDRALVARHNTTNIKTYFNPVQINKQHLLAPVVNETLTLRRYAFPVAEIARKIEDHGIAKLRYKPLSSILAIYQDPDTYFLRVQQLGEVAAHIVFIAKAEQTSYFVLAKSAMSRLGEPNSDELHKLIFETFEQFHRIGIFSGTEIKANGSEPSNTD